MDLKKIENLTQLETFINGFEPEIGRFGGRFFSKANEGTYSLNEIVKCFDKVAQKTKAKEDPALKPLAAKIARNIRELDLKGALVVNAYKQDHGFLAVVTSIRQFFGNLFYNRDKVLNKYADGAGKDQPELITLREEEGPVPFRASLTAEQEQAYNKMIALITGGKRALAPGEVALIKKIPLDVWTKYQEHIKSGSTERFQGFSAYLTEDDNQKLIALLALLGAARQGRMLP